MTSTLVFFVTAPHEPPRSITAFSAGLARSEAERAGEAVVTAGEDELRFGCIERQRCRLQDLSQLEVAIREGV